MFIGRSTELENLKSLLQKDTASLVTVTGRRRIGKSRLIQEYSKEFKYFYQFQGLAPRKNLTIADQLLNFENQLKSYTNRTIPRLNNWYQAFDELSKIVKKHRTLIFLDEISWMAYDSPDFPGLIKIVWDTKFKDNNKLVFVLCGSVSSWVEENILNKTDFVGRISHRIDLKELALKEVSKFWGGKLNTYEILKILSITGGVPKYLEEINVKKTVDENLINLCFRPSGLLFNEYETIFSDIFGSRSSIYKTIVSKLINSKETPIDLATKSGHKQNGVFVEYLRHLELSGFIARDYTFFVGKSESKLSRLRLKDNYLRFYLKYIEPNYKKISSNNFTIKSLSQLINWESVMGLQLENLVLNNTREILKRINLSESQIKNMGSFFQTKTSRNKGACQIDLLIETTSNTAYICEIKCRNNIDSKVIQEVQKKIDIIAAPKRFSLRPILIYDGDISERTYEKLESYFDYIIAFDDLV